MRLLNLLLLALVSLIRLSPYLGAEEFTLAFKKAELSPRYSYGFKQSELNQVRWTNQAEVLTDRAITLQVSLGFAGEEDDQPPLVSFDTLSSTGEHPDTLYVDLNNNSTIDENEKFTLQPVEHAEGGEELPYPVFYAEKVPHARKVREATYLNVYLLLPPTTEQEEPDLFIGTSSWGCYEGIVKLKGKEFKATITDLTQNGSYTDFQEDAGRRQDYFSLVSKDADGEEAVYARYMPLRRKRVIDGQAYTVDLRNNGETLIMTPIDAAFGGVRFNPPNVKIMVSNDEWGRQWVDSGSAINLPQGTWKVSQFSLRSTGEADSIVTYRGPSDLVVEIVSDQETVFDLATEFEGSVNADKTEKGYHLNLNLLTTQKAVLVSCINGTKQEEGVPFKILDKEGGTILESLFTFG
ncbi:MAG: hypothetical protein KJ645_05155 [Planctomycetes bacterium]|nr:hypothetical protein [Planctomycetota bacterium]